MKLFVYSYIDFFEYKIQLRTIFADSVMDALKKIFFKECSDCSEELLIKDWESFNSPEEVVDYFLEGEIAITIPVLVESLLNK